MYKCPISIISQWVDEQIKEQHKQEETAIVAEITRKIGVDVDKDELIRTLNYDRHQYEKGYADGRMSGKYEVESKLVHLSSSHFIGSEYLNRLEAQNADSDYKEFIKKKLCNDIGQYLYDNNLVSFTESEGFDGGTIIRADVQVYDENKEEEDGTESGD